MATVVMITGANRGIGFEVARQLGRSGFTVLLGARDASRGEAAAAKLRAEGFDVRPVVADLDHANETGTALAGQIQKEFGHLDVLINNAGTFDLTGGDGPSSKVSIDAMKSTFATNFFGTVEFTQPSKSARRRSAARYRPGLVKVLKHTYDAMPDPKLVVAAESLPVSRPADAA